jgi:hypothetical protein
MSGVLGVGKKMDCWYSWQRNSFSRDEAAPLRRGGARNMLAGAGCLGYGLALQTVWGLLPSEDIWES